MAACRRHALGITELLVDDEHPPALGGEAHQPHGLVVVIGQRLLAQEVLAGLEHGGGNRALHPRVDGDVDDLDGRIRSQLLVRTVDTGNSMPARDVGSALQIDVRDADDVEPMRRVRGQMREVDNLSRTDDGRRPAVRGRHANGDRVPDGSEDVGHDQSSQSVRCRNSPVC
jgi:hypothetical protein